MSNPRPTARELAETLKAACAMAIGECGHLDCDKLYGYEHGRDATPCAQLRDLDLTAAILADRAASDAREDRLRLALERVAWLDPERKDCGECGWSVGTCDRRKGIWPRSEDTACYGYTARAALAAVPPGSDR